MPTAIREKISSAVMNVGGFSEIRIAASLLNRLRDSVLEGYTSSRRGSVDVGGLLYGRLERGMLVLEDSRVIDCEHLLGPRFVLSESDETKLAQLLSRAQADSNLKNLQPVGWYCSHSRSDLLPSLEDTIFADKFFNKPGAVTLIVKPDNAVTTSAALHIRQADGSILNNAADLITMSTLPSRELTLAVRKLDVTSENPVAQSAVEKLVRADRIVEAERPHVLPVAQPTAPVFQLAASIPEPPAVVEPEPEPTLPESAEVPKPRKWIKQPVIPASPAPLHAEIVDEGSIDYDESETRGAVLAQNPPVRPPQAPRNLKRDTPAAKPPQVRVNLRRRNGLLLIAGVALVLFLVGGLALWQPWTGAAGNTAAMKLELEPRGSKLVVKWSDGPSTANNAVLTLQEGLQSRTVSLTGQYAPSGFTSIQPKDQSIKATLHVYGKAGEQVAYASYRLPFPLQVNEPSAPPSQLKPSSTAPPAGKDTDSAQNEAASVDKTAAATAPASPTEATTTPQEAPKPKKSAPVRRRGW